MERKIKIWKTIRIFCLLLLAVFAAGLVLDAIKCMGRDYPMPMMGIDACNWADAFCIDLAFIMLIGGLPVLAVIVLLILSCVKLRKYSKL